MLRDYGLYFLALLSVVLILKHQHVCLLYLEVECILEFLGLLRRFLFQPRKLSLTLLNNSVDIDESIITKHLLFLLKDFSSTVNKNFLILLFSECFLRCNLARLDDYLVEFETDRLSLQDFLLNCGLSDESVHVDLLLLADSMGTIHRLQVYLRVPVGVIEYDMVG